MLAISQKPDRVSNILRSSTRSTRVKGIGVGVVRGLCAVGGRGGAVVARALMPLLLR